MKSILDLHENIFHEIFQFLDNHTIYGKLRGVCSALKIYADSFIQLAGVVMFLGYGHSQLLHTYKLRKNIVSISVQSRMPYPAFHTIKNLGSFWGILNGRIVVGNTMRSEEGLWVQDSFKNNMSKHKRKTYWPCELMLKHLYEYNPKENNWKKFNQIDRSSPKNNTYVMYDHHFRAMWYPIGNTCLILALKNSISKKYVNELGPTCFPDPLIITSDYRNYTLYDVNTKQSFNYFQINKDLCSYLNIPIEISTLRDFDIVRVAANKIIIVGGTSSLGPNSWLWQGELTNKGSLIKWSRKCNIEGVRYFYSGNPFFFKLGDALYFLGYNVMIDSGLIETWNKSHQRQENLYCDRYDITEGMYKTNVHSVPSNLWLDNITSNPRIVLKDKHETFVVITAGPNNASFLFTADKGFNNDHMVIVPKAVSWDYLFKLFPRSYYTIKVL